MCFGCWKDLKVFCADLSFFIVLFYSFSDDACSNVKTLTGDYIRVLLCCCLTGTTQSETISAGCYIITLPELFSKAIFYAAAAAVATAASIQF